MLNSIEIKEPLRLQTSVKHDLIKMQISIEIKEPLRLQTSVKHNGIKMLRSIENKEPLKLLRQLQREREDCQNTTKSKKENCK